MITPQQAELLPSNGPSIADIVGQTVALVIKHTIDIPRISVVPKGSVKSGYKPFNLDVSKIHFQPQDQQIVSRGLQSGIEKLIGQASSVTEARLEDYIVRELINFDDVSYDEHAELIYDMAGQAVAHFQSYLKTQEDLHNVLANQCKAIADNIHLQMFNHYFEDISESEVVISQGFTPLKPSAITTEGEVLTLHQAPPEKRKIAQVVYGGFEKCAYTYQKFHSDTERVCAAILERDALLWFRPLSGQFNIYYRDGVNQPEYVPDFVATTATSNYIIETKKAADMESAEVKEKSAAAREWCNNASEYSQKYGGKPWKYLLIPHDAVAVNKTLQGFSSSCL
jgi:type III restriction enzyme